MPGHPIPLSGGDGFGTCDIGNGIRHERNGLEPDQPIDEGGNQENQNGLSQKGFRYARITGVGR
jgi:hypothetical protein